MVGAHRVVAAWSRQPLLLAAERCAELRFGDPHPHSVRVGVIEYGSGALVEEGTHSRSLDKI
jgi:hypothetical protein